jgi:hypothetical protein
MEKQNGFLSITANLSGVFNYSFVETVPYEFFIPKPDKYIPVNLTGKMYHCQKCGKEVEVRYHHTGVTYFSKSRLAAQRRNYEKLGLDFPVLQRIEAEEPFTNHAIGYCGTCAEDEILCSMEYGQRIYNLCETMHKADENIVLQARMHMGDVLQRCLHDEPMVAEFLSYDIQDQQALCNLISSVILRDTKAIAADLSAYRSLQEKLAAEINDLQALQPAAWPVYASRPTDAYESMSDEFYHEYTVAFPAAGTCGQNFYIYRMVEKNRVRLFVEQRRIATLEELLLEAGIQPLWVQWFMAKGIGTKA